MLKKIFTTWTILAILFTFTAVISTAWAEGYKALKPCFIDVPGWEGGKFDGMFMNMGGTTMLHGNREYKKGEKAISVLFTRGMSAAGMFQSMPQDMHMESGDESMRLTTKRGYKVQLIEQKGDEKGSHIMIFLDTPKNGQPASILMFQGESVLLKDLMPFAEKFDWGCFVKKAASLK